VAVTALNLLSKFFNTLLLEEIKFHWNMLLHTCTFKMAVEWT